MIKPQLNQSNKRIFSGIQPTGNLHLGNYLGAIKNFVELNNEIGNQCIFCVVDLHAITVKQDPIKLKEELFSPVSKNDSARNVFSPS